MKGIDRDGAGARDFRRIRAGAGALLAALLAVASSRVDAVPVLSASLFCDDFSDTSGLTFRQNVQVGPSLTPGVRVSRDLWSWAQPYTAQANAISTPFSDPLSRTNLTEVSTCSTCLEESVGLWRRTFQAGRDFILNGSVIGTTIFSTLGIAEARHFDAVALNGSDLQQGPFQADLVPGEDYTATYRIGYCDDPGCCATPACKPPDAEGAKLANLEIWHGGKISAFPLHLGPFPSGNFLFGEGKASPVTLEWTVPSPLPPGSGWEYRVNMTLTASGDPAFPPCAAALACTATVWVETVSVQASGHPIAAPSVPFATTCPPGRKPCRDGCVDERMPCGWDASTVYVGSGSYVSPVFDSLSEKTVWDSLVWEADQNYGGGFGGGVPATPIAIKWRVGNTPDPSIWLADPTWYTWTLPMSVTCEGEREDPDGTDNCDPDCRPNIGLPDTECDCSGKRARDLLVFPCPTPYPPPLLDEGQASMAIAGTPTTGRYFQYEVDFTGHYANGRFPPEHLGAQREMHPSPRPELHSMRIDYRPATGRIISATVAPPQLSRWAAVSYETDVSSGGSIQVDVLDDNDVPLFTNIASGFSLEGLDPSRYPRLRLRASLNNDGDDSQRPKLERWCLSWEIVGDPLRVDRNSLRVSRGDVVTITVSVFTTQTGTVTVHDAAGQLVRRFRDGVIHAGSVAWTWDGRNEWGDPVVPGVYFISLRTQDSRRVVRLAVME